MQSLFDERPFDEGFPIVPIVEYENFSPATEAPEGMQVFYAKSREKFASGREAVCYRVRDGHELRMFVTAPYVEGTPEEMIPTLPLLIFVQGSGYHRQNLMKNVPQIPAFAQRGFVVALVELTPTEVAPFPAAVEDLKAAIRAAKCNAEKLHIDPEKIILWGDSSGAGRSVMAAVTGDGVCDLPGPHKQSCSVAAVVDYFGPADLWDLAQTETPLDHKSAESAAGWLMGRKPVLENKDLALAASPVSYIEAGKPLPPFLILHGDMDRVVPFRQSVLLFEKLKRMGHEAAFYKVPGADHSTTEFWSESTFDLVEMFIRQHI